MTIEKQLKKILAKQSGIDEKNFSIEEYFREGWISEESLFRAIKTLVRQRRK